MAIDRRLLLKNAAALPFFGTVPLFAWAAGENGAVKADHTLRIAPVTLELAPGKTIRTTGYNGTVPGPVLRLPKGGRSPSMSLTMGTIPNRALAWPLLPAVQDGATEEGSPIIPVGHSQLYSFTPKPSGTRWYHSHAMAMADLTRSTYSGEFGFLLIEPAAGDPGRYDREVLLAARHWEGSWVSMQDIHKGPPPDNGLEVMYHSATLGERTLGHDEPICVRAGERDSSGSLMLAQAWMYRSRCRAIA